MEETLGKRIAANRKRLGMTQDQLAEKLGVTAQAVSKWENDQSCPDITTLPRLATIFGTTTDALLGMEPRDEPPVHRAEVIPSPEEKQSSENNKWNIQIDAGRMGGIAFALWVLLVGGALLYASVCHLDTGFWDVLWPCGLLIFGLFGLYPKFSFFRFGCGLLGGYFLLSALQVPVPALGKDLLLPIALLLFGLSLLADALGKNKKPSFHVTHNGNQVTDGEKKHTTHLSQEGTRFECDTCFGDDRHLVELDHLTQGEASVSFGSLTVDLTGCKSFGEHCHIEADCSFGELTLLIPRSCRTELDRDTAFGSVDTSGEPAPNASSVIHLECDANFGSIRIKYV